ncbi:MAG: preprotein translocase subunit YajC [Clostridia bacterium]|nr:preprotein translocase subunit YajC [Clostridia bacterium]
MPTEVAGAAGGFFGTYGTTIVMVLIMVVMFAIMIIPQRKREKKIKEMLNAMKPGDKVRTIGGIYGTLTAVKEDVVTMVVGPDKVKLVFARGAIANVEDAAVENTMSEELTETKK